MSTIAAIGTSLGTSGINIIRISGENSLNVIKNIFSNSSKLRPNEIHYGKIVYENTELDSVLVSYFKAPNSFTGEDVIEINCHGGTYITNKILDIVIKNGCEMAEPGEFSKRAYLNGKMDLSEAEATIDLINSKTAIESRIANAQMSGKLKEKIIDIRDKMIEKLAHIDVNVDYPEYDYEQLSSEEIDKFLNYIISELSSLINSYEEGKIIKNGVNVAILGRPNAGKSSLLNYLAGKERAIVTDIEGTTRDIITETVNIGDLILNINDTAGIRKANDEIERRGIEKSFEILDEIDLILYMFDPGNEIEEEEKEILSKIQNKGIKMIYVINKSDLYKKSKFDTFLTQIDKKADYIYVSVKEEKGIEELKQKIKQMFLNDSINNIDKNIIVNSRHKNLLEKANELLNKAKYEVKIGMPLDMVAISLKESAKYLGRIIGEDIDADISKKVFEKFCIGK